MNSSSELVTENSKLCPIGGTLLIRVEGYFWGRKRQMESHFRGHETVHRQEKNLTDEYQVWKVFQERGTVQHHPKLQRSRKIRKENDYEMYNYNTFGEQFTVYLILL